MALKRIVYLKKEDFTTLKNTGTVIVDGKTITYSEDDDYRVPDETQEQIADLQAEQAVQGAKITTLQSAVNNLKLEMFPVGSRYTQYPDEPEPAERFGGQWELDEDAMDKFLVGAGNLYALGTTGGSADGVVVEHSHPQLATADGGGWAYPQVYRVGSYSDVAGGVATTGTLYNDTETGGRVNTEIVGEDGTNKNLPPYLAVNIWKRTA